MNDLAIVLYLGVVIASAINGSKDPSLGLDKRSYMNRLFFHKLSAKDHGRIFFLAPWIRPYGLRRSES